VSASLRIDPNWPLVLLPGTLCDARVFGPWLDAMAGEPIMQGRGVLHAELTGCDSAAALATRLLEILPTRFIPVGFSLGAIITLEMALLAPDRIAAMVLVAANSRDVPPADHTARRNAAATDPVTLVSDILWPRYVAPSRQGDGDLRDLITDMARSAPPECSAMQTEIALTRSDKRPWLAEMAMPALILSGALDLISPSILQQELAAGLPNATLCIAPDAGHFLPLERPDFCARALAEWLAATSVPNLSANPMEVS
jgi:pimeloyl-ACP methyl ester carboxylesterase